MGFQWLGNKSKSNDTLYRKTQDIAQCRMRNVELNDQLFAAYREINSLKQQHELALMNQEALLGRRISELKSQYDKIFEDQQRLIAEYEHGHMRILYAVGCINRNEEFVDGLKDEDQDRRKPRDLPEFEPLVVRCSGIRQEYSSTWIVLYQNFGKLKTMGLTRKPDETALSLRLLLSGCATVSEALALDQFYPIQ